MFIHPGSRKVYFSLGTDHPNEAWVKQQAENHNLGRAWRAVGNQGWRV